MLLYNHRKGTDKKERGKKIMKTINDYKAMVQELRELGQILLDQQDDEEIAAWADEVECMDMHFKYCLEILEEVLE